MAATSAKAAAPHKRTQQERRQASRAALIESAAHRFHEKGYARTTIADIVGPTEYSAGAFYHHFANKAECMRAVIDRRHELRRDLTTVPREMDPASDDLQAVVQATFAFLDGAYGTVNGWSRVMVGFVEQHADEPDTLAQVAEDYRLSIGAIAEWVAVLQEQGWVDGTRDADLVAIELFGLVEGIDIHADVFDLSAQERSAAVADGVLRILGD